MDAPLPSGQSLRTRVIGLSAALSVASVLVIIVYLATLLRLSAAQWQGFAWIVGCLFLPAFAVYGWIQAKTWQPIVRCLDRRHEGSATPEDRRAGFAAVINVPIQEFYTGICVWTVSGVIVAVLMAALFELSGFFAAAIIVAASVSGGLVACIFHFYVVKRFLTPVRTALAADLGDPERRRSLVRGVPLARKLLVSVTGVTLVLVVFGIFVAELRSARGIERHLTRIQGNFLAEVAPAVEAGGPEAVAEVLSRARSLGVADGVGIVSVEAGEVVAGDLEGILSSEIADLCRLRSQRGDSVAFQSPNVLSWRRLGDGGDLLVAVTTRRSLEANAANDRAVLAILLLVSTGLSLAVARMIARDVSAPTLALKLEVERMSSGDLRGGHVIEAEDELGDLSRSFEAMKGFLRVTVGRVADAADRFEQTAGELAAVSQNLAAVTDDQVSGTRQAVGSMESINEQVRGIADASQALSMSVEESSSTILELSATGDELDETASVLSEQVEAVSSSIEQMVRSVKQVSGNTESLGSAAESTSSAMNEMASSMRAVDTAAEEAVELSRQVVAIAERGQSRVRETIDGMEAIRRETETAAEVIASLGELTKEIGTIVGVIDEVADETNLLALNAAIIAAQAGEHGRSFAVVADEIKDLADRVLASTKEIGTVIASVQDQSERAVRAMADGSRSVASGVALSAQAGESLEEITRASRESGGRIGGIVAAVREQAAAAARVLDLMERVRDGVDEIRSATEEQTRGNEVVYRGAATVREVSSQVRATTQEQSRGSGRIRQSIEEVRRNLEQINNALEEQSAACRSAVEFVEEVSSRTQANQESARRLGEAAHGLVGQAEALREDLRRFRL